MNAPMTTGWVASGVIWDPAHRGEIEREWIDAGFLVAAADIALARPAPAPIPTGSGVVEAIATVDERAQDRPGGVAVDDCGGVRVDILTSGIIRVGDRIKLLADIDQA